MKKVHYEVLNSSFLSLEKDYRLIINKLLGSEDFKRLLYRTDKTCLTTSCPDLTDEEVADLLENDYIKIVPKVEVEPSLKSQVIISFDNFVPSENNEFRDCSIIFDIICNFDLWQLTDFQLRPYKIAGIIDGLFNNQKLTGIGTIQFTGASQIVLNDELAGLTLMYRAVHGSDDKVK